MTKDYSYRAKQNNICFLVISPHPDDAALSMGGLLNSCDGNWEKHILTLVGKSNYVFNRQTKVQDIASISSRRLREDLQFCEIINATLHQGNAIDAPLRRIDGEPFYLPKDAHISEFEAIIDSILINIHPSIIFAPLGIGGHADHIASYYASINVAKRRKVDLLFYEDLPYAYSNYNDLPKPQEKWIFPLGKTIFRKIDNLKVYKSQFELPSMKAVVMNHAWNRNTWVERFYAFENCFRSKEAMNLLKMKKKHD